MKYIEFSQFKGQYNQWYEEAKTILNELKIDPNNPDTALKFAKKMHFSARSENELSKDELVEQNEKYKDVARNLGPIFKSTINGIVQSYQELRPGLEGIKNDYILSQRTSLPTFFQECTRLDIESLKKTDQEVIKFLKSVPIKNLEIKNLIRETRNHINVLNKNVEIPEESKFFLKKCRLEISSTETIYPPSDDLKDSNLRKL